jgi:hypothetical protein
MTADAMTRWVRDSRAVPCAWAQARHGWARITHNPMPFHDPRFPSKWFLSEVEYDGDGSLIFMRVWRPSVEIRVLGEAPIVWWHRFCPWMATKVHMLHLRVNRITVILTLHIRGGKVVWLRHEHSHIVLLRLEGRHLRIGISERDEVTIYVFMFQDWLEEISRGWAALARYARLEEVVE